MVTCGKNESCNQIDRNFREVRVAAISRVLPGEGATKGGNPGPSTTMSILGLSNRESPGSQCYCPEVISRRVGSSGMAYFSKPEDRVLLINMPNTGCWNYPESTVLQIE
jgi:hypothetical protein